MIKHIKTTTGKPLIQNQWIHWERRERRSDLSRLDVPDVDSFVLVQRDGVSSDQHLHGSGRDVLDRAPQHPAVSRATQDSASPGTLRLLRPLLFGLLVFGLADRTVEREEEDGDKG